MPMYFQCKMEEYSQMSSTQSTHSLQDDAVAHVLGPERQGRVRGLGFGVTLSKVDLHKQENETVKKLQDEVYNLNQQLNELKAAIVLQGMSQNVVSGQYLFNFTSLICMTIRIFFYIFV